MQAAREIATAALGRDPGPLAAVASGSHRVYLGPDVVVKIIDVAAHARLDREIALAADLPVGLTAPLLGSGVRRLGTGEVRYACYARVPGDGARDGPARRGPGDRAAAGAERGPAARRTARLDALGLGRAHAAGAP